MEVGVQLLRLVFVVMNTEFVVVSRLVLPLGTGLHTEQLHELLDLHLRVLAAEALSSAEETVFGLRRPQRVPWRPFIF